MNSKSDPNTHDKKSQQNSQFSQSGVYVRVDDQDWGSAGMNDIKQEFNISK